MLPARRGSEPLTRDEVDALAEAALCADREFDSLARLLDEVHIGPEIRLSLSAAAVDADAEGLFADRTTEPYTPSRRL